MPPFLSDKSLRPWPSFCHSLPLRKDSPAIRRDASQVQITLLAQGLRGMREYRSVFAAHSRATAFCPPILQNCSFEHLTSLPPEKIHIGRQVGKVYRIVLREDQAARALLVVLLEFVAQPKKKSRQGTTETMRRLQLGRVAPGSSLSSPFAKLLPPFRPRKKQA